MPSMTEQRRAPWQYEMTVSKMMLKSWSVLPCFKGVYSLCYTNCKTFRFCYSMQFKSGRDVWKLKLTFFPQLTFFLFFLPDFNYTSEGSDCCRLTYLLPQTCFSSTFFSGKIGHSIKYFLIVFFCLFLVIYLFKRSLSWIVICQITGEIRFDYMILFVTFSPSHPKHELSLFLLY